MLERSLRTHFWITVAILVGATVLLHAGTNRRNRVPLHRPLQDMPLNLGGWRGVDLPLTQHIIEALHVDDHVNRTYSDAAHNQVELYVGYFGSQRRAELIHSPRNCLPAAGWEWARTGRLTTEIPGRGTISVNDFRIVKGREQNLVLYWYHGRGRAIAGEYPSKFWTIADALTRNRTDGALVRLVIPIHDREADARAIGVAFLHDLYPHLNEFIPD